MKSNQQSNFFSLPMLITIPELWSDISAKDSLFNVEWSRHGRFPICLIRSVSAPTLIWRIIMSPCHEIYWTCLFSSEDFHFRHFLSIPLTPPTGQNVNFADKNCHNLIPRLLLNQPNSCSRGVNYQFVVGVNPTLVWCNEQCILLGLPSGL